MVYSILGKRDVFVMGFALVFFGLFYLFLFSKVESNIIGFILIISGIIMMLGAKFYSRLPDN